jgi:hypothetical protein
MCCRNIKTTRGKNGKTWAHWHHILVALDKLMTELPVSIVALNFKRNDYITKNGRKCRLIEFSEDVLTNVLAVVGGKPCSTALKAPPV